MLNPSVLELGQKRSTIRELFAFGQQRAAVVGAENIFDFSIGNTECSRTRCNQADHYRASQYRSSEPNPWLYSGAGCRFCANCHRR